MVAKLLCICRMVLGAEIIELPLVTSGWGNRREGGTSCSLLGHFETPAWAWLVQPCSQSLTVLAALSQPFSSAYSIQGFQTDLEWQNPASSCMGMDREGKYFKFMDWCSASTAP